MWKWLLTCALWTVYSAWILAGVARNRADKLLIPQTWGWVLFTEGFNCVVPVFTDLYGSFSTLSLSVLLRWSLEFLPSCLEIILLDAGDGWGIVSLTNASPFGRGPESLIYNSATVRPCLYTTVLLYRISLHTEQAKLTMEIPSELRSVMCEIPFL